MDLDRRRFLRAAGIAAGALLLPRGAVRAMRGRAENRVLVVLFLRGGADGLNLVVPRGDPHYALLRPTIGVARQALDLDGFFALHPSLAPLRPLYGRGELGFVHAVGNPFASRSHTGARHALETALPAPPHDADGWLNRTLALLDGIDPWAGIRLGHDSGSRSLRGATPHLRVASLRRYGPPRGQGRLPAPLLRRLYAGRDRELREAVVTALEGAEALAAAPDADETAYPPSEFGRALADAAALVKGDIGVRILTLHLGGWDHHQGQALSFGPVCDELASGVAAFRRDLGTHWARTLVLGMTEFGRTAAENASGGTDHGAASVMFACGGSVRGDRVLLRDGRWPGLAPGALRDGRELAVTTDFRDVFAEVLVRHLGLTTADLGFVLPGFAADARRFPGLVG